jgi:hypothetical protein
MEISEILRNKEEIEKRLISPISSDVLEKELYEEADFIAECPQNEGGLKIFILGPNKGKNLLQEVGRLRELMFSLNGGGTGLNCDLDEFDDHYSQEIVWDSENREIVGGYRFIIGSQLTYLDGKIHSAVSELFRFSDDFIENKLKKGIELGRSFVNLFSKKSRYGLRALWYGLGYLTKKYDFQYFFGKVTFYPMKMKKEALDLVFYFLENQFPGLSTDAKPLDEILYSVTTPAEDLEKLNDEKFNWSENYDFNFPVFRKKLKVLKENYEPLLKSYMDLGNMTAYGGAFNASCGGVVEILIVVNTDGIDEIKIQQFTSLEFNM